ncbi:hypothetical protein PIB30_026897 [Stylosanthes scabra]|uniref:Agenet domain-containing protein n=1 Tax=Stylosanthes scabra TaxID=79078 RepID=A0ABU6VC65_9FABA|nr:hypothetical protein [Stylosanthes scabra]
MPPPNRRVTLRRGSNVEVIGKEEGFFGSYYEATIFKCLGMGCYVVQYMNLLEDSGRKPLLDVVRLKDIRPIPPDHDADLDGFEVNQCIDVYDNEGWWVGEIKSKRRRGEYFVYFSSTNEEIVYSAPQIRTHMEWSNGSWTFQNNRTQQ